MKRKIKTISLLLVVIMLIGIFSACSGEKAVSVDGTFTYWTSMSGTASQTLESYNDLMMYQEISKRTGINVEFIHPASGSTGSEAFQILMASGNYPDMIEYKWDSYAGGPQQAIDDGVIIAINKYMKDYAPNYYEYMEGEKGKENQNRYKAQSMTNEGNYFGFRNLNIGDYRGFMGLYVRKDKLNEWGLNIPVTIDDWTELFAIAKDNGFKIPFTCHPVFLGVDRIDLFNGAYHVSNKFYIDGNKIKFGPFESAYKEYLDKMVEWTKAGYIDKDFVTNTDAIVEGNMTNGTSVATAGYIGSGIGRLIPAMRERDPEYSLVACPYPVLKEGDTPWFQEVQAESKDVTIAITVDCGNEDEDRYKAAVKWCDYVYGEEGNILKCFGIEGETFTIEKDENGEEHFVYTDKIMDHEKLGAHSVEAALYHFMRPANSPGLNQHPDYLKGFYPYEEQLAALDTWNEYVDEAKLHILPPLSYSGEEATVKANVEFSAKVDLQAAVNNIILGKASIDTLDDAIKKAKENGYSELLEIQQAAYDRYLKLLK